MGCGDCFLAAPLSISNQFEILVFIDGEKPQYPARGIKDRARTNSKLDPFMPIPGQNFTRPTWKGGGGESI